MEWTKKLSATDANQKKSDSGHEHRMLLSNEFDDQMFAGRMSGWVEFIVTIGGQSLGKQSLEIVQWRCSVWIAWNDEVIKKLGDYNAEGCTCRLRRVDDEPSIYLDIY